MGIETRCDDTLLFLDNDGISVFSCVYGPKFSMIVIALEALINITPLPGQKLGENTERRRNKVKKFAKISTDLRSQ